MSASHHADSAFAAAVVLTKREVFDALEACADAERALLRSGRASAAAGVAALFELLEDRVILDPVPMHQRPTPVPAVAASPIAPVSPAPVAYVEVADPSGSNSSDSELTQ